MVSPTSKLPTILFEATPETAVRLLLEEPASDIATTVRIPRTNGATGLSWDEFRGVNSVTRNIVKSRFTGVPEGGILLSKFQGNNVVAAAEALDARLAVGGEVLFDATAPRMSLLTKVSIGVGVAVVVGALVYLGCHYMNKTKPKKPEMELPGQLPYTPMMTDPNQNVAPAIEPSPQTFMNDPSSDLPLNLPTNSVAAPMLAGGFGVHHREPHHRPHVASDDWTEQSQIAQRISDSLAHKGSAVLETSDDWEAFWSLHGNSDGQLLKYVLTTDGRLHVGSIYFNGKENPHQNISGQADASHAEAAGYLKAGPHGEILVGRARSTAYPDAASGDSAVLALQSRFGEGINVSSSDDFPEIPDRLPQPIH